MKRGGAYRGSTPIGDLALLGNDPAETMRTVTVIYKEALREIREWRRTAALLQSVRKPMFAECAWHLGDIVHRLESSLQAHGCRLDGLYEHLERHAGVSPKWISPFVTFRRYVASVDKIPDGLKWRRVAKAPKFFGKAISSGIPVEM